MGQTLSEPVVDKVKTNQRNPRLLACPVSSTAKLDLARGRPPAHRSRTNLTFRIAA